MRMRFAIIAVLLATGFGRVGAEEELPQRIVRSSRQFAEGELAKQGLSDGAV